MSFLFDEQHEQLADNFRFDELQQEFVNRELEAPTKKLFDKYPMRLLEAYLLCTNSPMDRRFYHQLAEQFMKMLNGLCKRNEEIELSADDLMRTCFLHIAQKGRLNAQVKQLTQDKAQLAVSSTQQLAEINKLTVQLDALNHTIATLTEENGTLKTDNAQVLRANNHKERQVAHLQAEMHGNQGVLAKRTLENRSLKRKLADLQGSSFARSPVQDDTTSPFHTPLQSPVQDDLGSSLFCTETTQRLLVDLGLNSGSDTDAEEKPYVRPLLNLDN